MKRRRFDQLCGVAAGLDVVGDRWALLVVRELLFSPKRFMDLVRQLPGIGTNTLTTRLVELEKNGIIRARTLSAPLSVDAYELTPRGRELIPVLVALARWGSARLTIGARAAHRMGPASLGLALLAYFEPASSRRKHFRIGLVFPDGSLELAVDAGVLRITEGEISNVALRLHATEETVLELVRGLLTVGRAARLTRLRMEGDGRLVSSFVAAFPLG